LTQVMKKSKSKFMLDPLQAIALLGTILNIFDKVYTYSKKFRESRTCHKKKSNQLRLMRDRFAYLSHPIQ
jgi:hypothetical protein